MKNSTMKNILIITNLYPTEYAPFRASFNKSQFSRLSEFYKIDLYIPVKIKEFFSLVYKNRDKASNSPRTYPILFLYIPAVMRFLQPAFLFMPFLIRTLSFRKKAYTCIIGSWAFPDGIVATLLGKLTGRPVIIKVHGSDINYFFKDAIRRKLILWSMHRADAIICVSQALKNILSDASIPQSKLHVIYNGVDKDIFNFKYDAPDRNTKKILFIGNIISTKGVFELYRAFTSLSQSKDIELCFIGDGDCKQTLINNSLDDGLEDKITFTGRLTQKEISQHIQESNLVCLPSYNEGVPNVLLEAKSCGRPVVATNVGGIPEIVSSDDGILVPPQDTESLAAAIAKCLDTDWNYQMISQQASQYSWDKNISAIDSLINTISSEPAFK